MNKYKILNIKGIVADKYRLERYLEQLASDHILKEKSDKNTYPIPRMKENFEVISQTYQLLNEHIKLKIPIHSAGEWLLDNYYVIEEAVKWIQKELTLKKYINFLGIANGAYKGFARIYVLASEIVAYTDAKITAGELKDYLNAYQQKKTLSMDEIWGMGTFLQIAMIENIRGVCEKIYSSQLQKYRVENILERLVEDKRKEELRFKNLSTYKAKVNEYGEMKYPFIEYMSYRLKKYGKKAYPFLNILEEQVNKMGTDITEVIQKEHFDIAVKKVTIGNCITSMKLLQRINFIDIFEQINQVEEILKQDPANVYDKMDYKTKINYRNKIKEIAQKTKISEIYIAKKCLELALRKKDILQNEKEKISESKENLKNEYNENNRKLKLLKQSHVGYYLLEEQGKQELLEIIQNRKVKKQSYIQKMKLYIFIEKAIAFLISILFGVYLYAQTKNIIIAIIAIILFYIPVERLVIQVIQYLLGKFVKPTLIPKLDFQNGVPKEYATFVVIPTILKSKQKIEELMKKLEVYYLANKSDNIYFALLGDCSESSRETENFDKEVEKAGITLAKKLNEKYPDEVFPKFHFIYRKRMWNEREGSFLGWERKRGLLNQFNEYLLKNLTNPFVVNTIEDSLKTLPNIQYVITLDSDTELVLNTGLELIGAMAHILNRPELNENKDVVINGHGIMQPRVGINLSEVQKTKFTKIYAGAGGTDSYTNAISDVYQDNFDEGIFAGKGIYDLHAFSEVLKNQIPENTVLSHDLLEGSYLRCGLVSDIMLMDGYPTSYNSFKTRLHRWTRGDIQILRWLKKKIKNDKGEVKQNSLGLISKYKILDNLMRSLFPPLALLSLIYLIGIDLQYHTKIWPAIVIIFTCLLSSQIIQLIDRIISKQDGELPQKTFSSQMSPITGNIIRGILEIGLLPDKAYMLVDAITKTIYRMCISKKHLLEWTTAEEAEKKAKNNLQAYYINMLPNVILGILGLTLLSFYHEGMITILLFLLSVLWIIIPGIMFYMGKVEKQKQVLQKINEQDKQYLLEIGQKTWQFFKDHLNERGNFLPPDNYQEDRIPKVVYRTSPTNIGLALLAVISSYDLGYENLQTTLKLLEKMLETVEKLSKWNGHLYNWYNIETLEPLIPKYVSTVDSGNFVGYLYVLKQFLAEIKVETVEKKTENQKETANNKETKINEVNLEQIDLMINEVNMLIQNTDFKYLYNKENKIFSIGYNVEENTLTDSYYDLLASEARQASLVAIAKKDIPSKHWYNLSRSLTILNKYKGLVSWSGTAFEYLMPNINIAQEEGSLLDEATKFAIMSQMEYAKKLNIPWGISEAAFNLRDLDNNYQYKAFGIPWLGIKRGLADEMVVAPYGSVLAVTEVPKEVIKNLKELEKQGMYQKYGFYESIDYTPNRLKIGEQYETVKTYMAHHQGLILLSINNLFHDKILQTRFMNNPEIKALDILLQERMPQNIIITKEEKEKVEKIKNVDYEAYSQREYNKINTRLNPINMISSNNYTIVIDQKGNGYSMYKNILINRFKETDEEEQGIFFYLKNIKTKRIWSSTHRNYLANADKYMVSFSPDKSKYVRRDGNIETTTQISIMPDEPVEIRTIELKNNGNIEETIELTSSLEPVLSTKEQDYAHKVFNNLFLSYEFIEEDGTILVKRNHRNKEEKDLYLAVNLYTKQDTIGEMEYEIDKEKFVGRGNLGLPEAAQKELPLSKKIGFTTDPIIAMKRTINIMPGKSAKFHLLITIAENREEAIKRIKDNLNNEKIARNLDLAKAKVQAENMYLGIKGQEIEVYQKMLGYLIYQNPLKILMLKEKIPEKADVSELWKYGISGDLPILLVTIKDVNDIDVVKECIKAYDYFRIKNIKIDLVILNEEKKTYDNYVSEEIQNAILDKNLGFLQNIKGGIFVLNHLEKKDKQILEYRANLLIYASLGEVGRQLKDVEEEYMERMKQIGKEQTHQIHIEPEVNRIELSSEKLKYNNEYGGFSEDGKEYHIRINKEKRLPTVWSHIMANESFGTVMTESMGGYSWYKNSRLNRISAWNNNPVTDVPSEIIYLKDMDTDRVWSLGLNPMPDDNDYDITYGFGYAKYNHTSSGVIQKLDVFVPQDAACKIQILHLENMQTQKKKIKLIYYIKAVLDEDELKSKGFLKSNYQENSNLFTLEHSGKAEDKTILYVSCSEKIQSYTGSKNSFIGRGSLANPEGINEIELDKSDSIGKEAIIAIEIKIELEALERKDIVFVMGIGESMIECQDKAYQYTNIQQANHEYEKEKRYWADLLGKLQVSTPLESANIMLNGWLIYQTICSRIFARSGYYQSGGAYGFRDQLQDTIGIKYIDSSIMKNQIIKHSKHQFLEGDVEHWWHEETGRGIRTRFSDDLLWLPYLVAEYIKFTGDRSILEEKTLYLKGEILQEGTDERYDKYMPSEIEETIYEHCIRAIEKSLNFGENGLPKIGSGDWNDGFSTVGNKGKGESIWLGFFLYTVLEKWIPICEEKGNRVLVEKYTHILQNLKKALNTNGWDGRWYRRAFMDNGDILGSLQNEECRIDSIAQSWATISGAGDNDKKYISMESLEKHLIDKENGMIKLLDPPFEKSNIEPGYIKSYLPGTRENGGQYTHGAIWAIIAEAMLGFGDKAFEYFRMINPIEHSRTKEEAGKYKVEPYVIAADIYGAGNLTGRGGWTWYTGSSSWFYEAGIKYILGMNIEEGILKLKPCIPSSWQEYSIRYKFGESIYNIKVTNPNRKCVGISSLKLNGKIVEDKQIKLVNTGGVYQIEAQI